MSSAAYPTLCTGCEGYVYESVESAPCPNCFPGLVRRYADEKHPTDEQVRAMAREEYGCDEVEVDDDAVVSRDHHTHGAFVAAWVWVTFNQPEGTE